jgi:hypothetical protein
MGMKIQRLPFTLARLAFVFSLALPLAAQSSNTISIRLLDGKKGVPIEASSFLVRIDHQEAVHDDWVTIKDDNTVFVNVPASAKEISIKATYDRAMEVYINCDIAKESDNERNIWYSIPEILKTGVVAPNECSKTNYSAKPGEFVFFVRKRGWHDKDNF